MVAERPRPASRPRRPTSLQWGRDAVVAERGGSDELKAALKQGFNGAATLWSRKAATTTRSARRKTASMGPRRCGRGKSEAAETRVSNSPASMGPRRCGRGKRHPNLSSVPAALASMGPRRCGRGKRPRRSPARTGRTASMGPRRCGRGKSGRARPAATSRSCFNGAATLWSRKASSASGNSWVCNVLQWGRDAVVAESASPISSGDSRTPLQWGRDAVVAESLQS